MSDDGGECGGVMVRKNMSGGKGGNRVIGCMLCKDGGWVMGGCVVRGDDGCLLNGGESMWGRLVFTFFFTGLVYRGIWGSLAVLYPFE